MNDLKRSRLKLTIFLVITLILLLYVPIDIIYIGVEKEKFDLVNPWAAFIAIISTIGLVTGYYINKETERSSLLTNIINMPEDQEKKVLPGEDNSDPDEMPF